jgi:flagellar M-ring protein FliF
MRALVKQLKGIWQGMSGGQRLILLLVSLLSVAIVLGVSYWAAQPDYRVLYSGLAEEDSPAIANKLQAQGASFRIAGGGTTILVPADQIQQRRLELAADGLPTKGGKGFELFDQSSLGMTPFTQHVNYLRALQAELAKTIMHIDAVAYARVHIVRPDPTPFIRDQKPTTASVMVRLKPGATLSRQLSAGIVALVARSVEGLTRENVTIVDSNGRLLSEEQNPETGIISSQMDYRRDLETYLGSKAENMLAQVFGPGRAIVRVTAEINFQKHHEKKETYNPEGRVVTTEKITTNKSTTAGPNGRGGPAGTASNLSKGNSQTPPPPPPVNSLDETIETNFAVSKTIQEFEDKMGTVERLTIAAMVDLSAVADSQAKDKSATPMTLADVQEIIKQAVGFKNNRDEIQVKNVKLNGPASSNVPEDDWHSVQQWQNIVNLVRNASLGVAALAALLLGWMFLRHFKAEPTPAKTESGEPPEQNLVLNRLSIRAQEDPQAMAQVLENWLESERTQSKAA